MFVPADYSVALFQWNLLSFQVLVTNLELEPVDHLEPANFWIGPSAVSLHQFVNCSGSQKPDVELWKVGGAVGDIRSEINHEFQGQSKGQKLNRIF